MVDQHSTEDFLRSLPQTDAWITRNLRALFALISEAIDRVPDERLFDLQDRVSDLIDSGAAEQGMLGEIEKLLSDWGMIEALPATIPSTLFDEEYIPSWDDQSGSGIESGEVVLQTHEYGENTEAVTDGHEADPWSTQPAVVTSSHVEHPRIIPSDVPSASEATPRQPIDVASELNARQSDQDSNEIVAPSEAHDQSSQPAFTERTQTRSARPIATTLITRASFVNSGSAFGPDTSIVETAASHLRETPPNYVAALNALSIISDPDSTLPPDELTRYTALKQQILDERSKAVEARVDIVSAIWEDDRKSLEDIEHAIVELLNNERLLLPGDLPELRELRASLESAAWDDRKADRFWSHIEAQESKHRSDPIKNIAWAEWLKETQTLLESALSPISKLNTKYRASFNQALERIRKERIEIERLLFLVSSRTSTGNYVELIHLCRAHPNDKIAEANLGDVLGRDLESQLLLEYAEAVLNGARTKIVTLFGSDQADALVKAALDQRKRKVKTRRLSFPPFRPDLPLDEIQKQIELALIDLKPSQYLDEFSTTVEGDRSIDPDESHLGESDRRSFIVLRDDILPTLHTHFITDVLRRWTDNSLETSYQLLTLWPSSSLIDRIRSFERSFITQVEQQYGKDYAEYRNGKFWNFRLDKGKLESFVKERLEPIERSIILSTSIPDQLDYTSEHKANQERLDQIRSFYMGLVTERAVVERGITELNETFTAIQERFAQDDEAETIRDLLADLAISHDDFTRNYFHSVPGLRKKVTDLQTINDERFGDQTVLDDALRLFQSAQDQERARSVIENASAWGDIRQKTKRFELPPKEKLTNIDVVRGHALHLFGTACESVYLSELRSDSETIQRRDDITRAKESCEALGQFFGSESILEPAVYDKLIAVLPTRQVEQLDALINAKLTQIDNEQRYKAIIDQLLKQHKRELSRASWPLDVYLETLDQFQSTMRGVEPGLIDALNNHLHNKFLHEFADVLRAELANSSDFDRNDMQRHLVTYRAIRWCLNNNHSDQLIDSGHEHFMKRMLQEVSSYMENAYSMPDRPVSPPYDLPFSIYDIATWFELIAPQRRVSILMTGDEQRNVALVSALYLLACTQQQDDAGQFHADIASLTTLISLLNSAPRRTEQLDYPEDMKRAIALVSKAEAQYVLMDGYLISVCDTRLKLDTSASTEQSDETTEALKTAQEYIARIAQTTEPLVQVMGQHWKYRLQALELFADKNYRGTRQRIREFRKLSTPSKGAMTSFWLRRRAAESEAAMGQLYNRLLTVFGGDQNEILIADDSVTIRRQLDLAILWLESSDSFFRDKGASLLRKLLGHDLLERVKDLLQQEFRTAMQNVLPRSLSNTVLDVERLHEDITQILDEEQFSRISNVKASFEALRKTLRDTLIRLTSAQHSFEEAQRHLKEVLENSNGINTDTDWNIGAAQADYSRCTEQVENALNVAGVQLIAGQRGAEDLVPLQIILDRFSEFIATFKSARQAIRNGLAFKLNTLSNSATGSNDSLALVNYSKVLDQIQGVFDARAGFEREKNEYPYYREMRFVIPDGFLVSNLGISLQNLHHFTKYAIPTDAHIRNEIAEWFQLPDSESETILYWLNGWSYNQQVITQIRGLHNHRCILELVVKRIETWHSAFAQVRTAYAEYYPEWLDVARWIAYFKEVTENIRAAASVGRNETLPSADKFNEIHMDFIERQRCSPKARPQGTYTNIRREISEHLDAAAKFSDMLSDFMAQGDIPPELSVDHQFFYHQLVDIESELHQDDLDTSDLLYGVPLTLSHLFDPNEFDLEQVQSVLTSRENLVSDEAPNGLGYLTHVIHENNGENDYDRSYLLVMEELLPIYEAAARPPRFGRQNRTALERWTHARRIWGILTNIEQFDCE